MRPVIPYVVAALLFGIGVFGVLRRRNAILLLMAVELMLNAVNVVLVTAATTVQATLESVGTPYTGHVFALFIIVIAAAEIGVGLAIVLQLFRLRGTAAVDAVPLTEPDDQGAGGDPYDIGGDPDAETYGEARTAGADPAAAEAVTR